MYVNFHKGDVEGFLVVDIKAPDGVETNQPNSAALADYLERNFNVLLEDHLYEFGGDDVSWSLSLLMSIHVRIEPDALVAMAAVDAEIEAKGDSAFADFFASLERDIQ